MSTAISSDNRRIRDARGRSITALDPLKIHLFGHHRIIDPNCLDAIVEELTPGAQWRRIVLRWVLPAFLLLAIAGIAMMFLTGGPAASGAFVQKLANPAFFGMYAGLFTTCILVPWITTRSAKARRVPSIMLKHRCCPHCGYGLRGLPVAPEDGTTICPECACAWRIDQPDRIELDDPHAPAGSRIAILLLLLGLTALAVCLTLGLVVWKRFG